MPVLCPILCPPPVAIGRFWSHSRPAAGESPDSAAASSCRVTAPAFVSSVRVSWPARVSVRSGDRSSRWAPQFAASPSPDSNVDTLSRLAKTRPPVPYEARFRGGRSRLCTRPRVSTLLHQLFCRTHLLS